ncbi:MAG TPA: hypothetical protein PK095_07985 [Myxococcota bacterium]|nr:hypothetical protein [Myxococcota bacterium]
MLALVVGVWVVLSVGCESTPAPEPAREATATLKVAPLTNIGRVDYRLVLSNAQENEVVRIEVDSDKFGDGRGSLAYVAPCYPTSNPNTLTLEILEIRDTDGATVPAGDWQNPTPVSVPFNCLPNADVPLDLNLVVVRNARQGFFDIGVTFEDIFCAAKLDCVRDGSDLELLFHPVTGQRDLTAVAGLACSAGDGAADTWLYLSNAIVSCVGGSGPIEVDVTGLGNVDLSLPPSGNPDGYLFGAGVYRGPQDLAGFAYWNVALGLDEASFAGQGVCTLRMTATASPTPLDETASGFATPTGWTWPVVTWEVPLSDTSDRLCSAHPIDTPPPGVFTRYASPTSPRMFQHEYRRSTDSVRSAIGGFDSCYDGLQNGDEEDVDCGGGCISCRAAGGTCDDSNTNAQETDLDCGGPTCPGCPLGFRCLENRDCLSDLCRDALCVAPSCDDDVMNGDETGVDCGGSCLKCAGQPATEPGECASGLVHEPARLQCQRQQQRLELARAGRLRGLAQPGDLRLRPGRGRRGPRGRLAHGLPVDVARRSPVWAMKSTTARRASLRSMASTPWPPTRTEGSSRR